MGDRHIASAGNDGGIIFISNVYFNVAPRHRISLNYLRDGLPSAHFVHGPQLQKKETFIKAVRNTDFYRWVDFVLGHPMEEK